MPPEFTAKFHKLREEDILEDVTDTKDLILFPIKEGQTIKELLEDKVQLNKLLDEFDAKIDDDIKYLWQHEKPLNAPVKQVGLLPSTIRQAEKNLKIFKENLRSDHFKGHEWKIYGVGKDFYVKISQLSKKVATQDGLDNTVNKAERAMLCSGGLMQDLKDIYYQLTYSLHGFQGQLLFLRTESARQAIIKLVDKEIKPDEAYHGHTIIYLLNSVADEFGLRKELDDLFATRGVVGLTRAQAEFYINKCREVVKQVLLPESIVTTIVDQSFSKVKVRLSQEDKDENENKKPGIKLDEPIPKGRIKKTFDKLDELSESLGPQDVKIDANNIIVSFGDTYRFAPEPTLAIVELLKRMLDERLIPPDSEEILAIHSQSKEPEAKQVFDPKQRRFVQQKSDDQITEEIELRRMGEQLWIEVKTHTQKPNKPSTKKTETQLEFITPERLQHFSPDTVTNELRKQGNDDEEINQVIADIVKRAIINSIYSGTLDKFPEAWKAYIPSVKLVDVLPKLTIVSSEERKQTMPGLIEMGIDQARDEEEHTPRLLAAALGFEETFEMFQSKETIKETNAHGQSALALALANGRTGLMETCIDEIFDTFNDNELEELLRAKNKDGVSALEMALRNGKDEAAARFVERIVGGKLNLRAKTLLLIDISSGTPNVPLLRKRAFENNCVETAKKLDAFYSENLIDRLSNKDFYDLAFANAGYHSVIKNGYDGLVDVQGAFVKRGIRTGKLNIPEAMKIAVGESNGDCPNYFALKNGHAEALGKQYEFVKVLLNAAEQNGVEADPEIEGQLKLLLKAQDRFENSGYGKATELGRSTALIHEGLMSEVYSGEWISEGRLATLSHPADSDGNSVDFSALKDNHHERLEKRYQFLFSSIKAADELGEGGKLKYAILNAVNAFNEDGDRGLHEAIIEGKAAKAVKVYLENLVFEGYKRNLVDVETVLKLMDPNVKDENGNVITHPDCFALEDGHGAVLEAKYEFIDKIIEEAKSRGWDEDVQELTSIIPNLSRPIDMTKSDSRGVHSGYVVAARRNNFQAAEVYHAQLLKWFDNGQLTEGQLCRRLFIEDRTHGKADRAALRKGSTEFLQSRYRCIDKAIEMATAKGGGQDLKAELSEITNSTSHDDNASYGFALEANHHQASKVFEDFIVDQYGKDRISTEDAIFIAAPNIIDKDTGRFNSADHLALAKGSTEALLDRYEFIGRIADLTQKKKESKDKGKSKEAKEPHVFQETLITVAEAVIGDKYGITAAVENKHAKAAQNHYQFLLRCVKKELLPQKNFETINLQVVNRLLDVDIPISFSAKKEMLMASGVNGLSCFHVAVLTDTQKNSKELLRKFLNSKEFSAKEKLEILDIKSLQKNKELAPLTKALASRVKELEKRSEEIEAPLKDSTLVEALTKGTSKDVEDRVDAILDDEELDKDTKLQRLVAKDKRGNPALLSAMASTSNPADPELVRKFIKKILMSKNLSNEEKADIIIARNKDGVPTIIYALKLRREAAAEVVKGFIEEVRASELPPLIQLAIMNLTDPAIGNKPLSTYVKPYTELEDLLMKAKTDLNIGSRPRTGSVISSTSRGGRSARGSVRGGRG